MDFWTLSLVVEADDKRPVLTPFIQLGGGTPFRSGLVRVGIVAAGDTIGGPVQQLLRPDDMGKQLRLPAIRFADPVTTEAALCAGWDVGVETDGLERIRWQRHLSVGTPILDDGAEIGLASSWDRIPSKAEDDGWGPEALWDARDTDRLLANLLEQGVISESDRQSVLVEAVTQKRTVERVVVDLGLLGEREMLEEYARVTGCEFLDLRTHRIDQGRWPSSPKRWPVSTDWSRSGTTSTSSPWR